MNRRASLRTHKGIAKSKQASLLLVAQLRAHLPIQTTITTEHRFHATRQWRFDVALLTHKLAIEIEGGVFVEGRHSRGAGFIDDCDKYGAAMLSGWRVLRVPQKWIWNGRAAAYAVAIVDPTADRPTPLPPARRRKKAVAAPHQFSDLL